MIQRIQSLYLSLTIILPLIFLKWSLLTFIDKSRSVFYITFKGIIRDAGNNGSELIEKLLPLSTLIILLPVLSFITLFLYKKRKIQIWLASIGIILSSCLIMLLGYYSNFVIVSYSASIVIGIKMAIPVLLLLFYILAYRGIRKDERLVKSYDRLR
jgi:uncharacterized BrkB/YihY/UPF0761 family membrane protein